MKPFKLRMSLFAMLLLWLAASSASFAQSAYRPVNVPPGLHNPRLPSEHLDYQPNESHPPGTPPCGKDYSPVPCYFGAPPSSPLASAWRPSPLPPVWREEDRWLKDNRFASVPQTIAHTLTFRASNPGLYPPHAPGPGPVTLCPSCRRPDGSEWRHQVPLLVGGRLLRRTPALALPHPWRLTLVFALEVLWWSLLLVGGAYFGTKYAQARAEVDHDRRVAARVARAAERAVALDARRQLLGGE